MSHSARKKKERRDLYGYGKWLHDPRRVAGRIERSTHDERDALSEARYEETDADREAEQRADWRWGIGGSDDSAE